MDVTLGLILAGGRATRLGGVEKALVELAGAPLLDHAIRKMRPQCAALAINANGDFTRLAPFALPVIADDPPEFAGPLAGILAGLEFAQRELPEITDVVSLAVDTPFAPADLVARLQSARRGPARIAVAASGGRLHYAVALWPVALADDLRRAVVKEGLRRVAHFADRHGVAVAEWPNEPSDPFFNVNTPEDLVRAQADFGRTQA